jgi:hypothetical protein
VTILEALKLNAPQDDRNQHLLAVMVNDPDASKVLSAWTYYGARCTRDRELRPDEDYVALGKKIWPRVDFERLSRLSGVHLGLVMDVFHRLKEARLLYPDGTSNEIALRLVRAEVGAVIRGITGRR